jgi:pilus assembly protein HofM
MALRESELASWVSHAMARELEMAAAALRFDYTEDALAQAYSVTAAQHKDVAEMLELATSLHLNLAS